MQAQCTPPAPRRQARRKALEYDFKLAAFESVGYSAWLLAGLTDHEFRILFALAKRVRAAKREGAR